MANELRPFHLAVPVHDLMEARKFYGEILGCDEGRSNNQCVDWIPVPHFGVVLVWKIWENLRDRLVKNEIKFIVEPYLRFEGQAGEQGTFFLNDFSGNALEFKTFKNINQLFAK